MPNPKFNFRLAPKEAISYLERKGFKQSFHYSEIMHEAHHRSFTVAKIMRDDLLKDIHTSLVQAKKDGIKFKEWKKSIKPTLKSYGWYGETEVFDPRTGEFKTIFVGSRRLRTIFGTNMRVSHAVARHKKMRSLPFSKYWMYVSMLLATTRDEHALKHQTVLHRDHPWWQTNYPPNDWNCYCKVRAYTKKVLDRRGIKVSDEDHENIASSDWAYNVGETDLDKLKKLRKKKMSGLPKDLKKAAASSLDIDEAFQKSYENAPVELQSYILTHRPKHKVVKDLGNPARYDTVTKTMLLEKEKTDLFVYRHELGHHIDTINGFFSVDAIAKTLKKDRLIWQQNKHLNEIEKLSTARVEDVALHDIFYLLSKRKYGEPTRRPEYNITPSVTSKEIFAHIFEMILAGDDRLDTIRKYLPATVNKIEQMLKDLK